MDSAPQQFAPPMPSHPLIGRADDRRRLRRLVVDPNVRQITITGPGGVGKTSLALQTPTDVPTATEISLGSPVAAG